MASKTLAKRKQKKDEVHAVNLICGAQILDGLFVVDRESIVSVSDAHSHDDCLRSQIDECDTHEDGSIDFSRHDPSNIKSIVKKVMKRHQLGFLRKLYSINSNGEIYLLDEKPTRLSMNSLNGTSFLIRIPKNIPAGYVVIQSEK